VDSVTCSKWGKVKCCGAPIAQHLLHLLGIWLCFLLWGCGGSTVTKSTLVPNNMPITIPPEITATKELLSPSDLQSLTKTNPFMSLIAPKSPEEDKAGVKVAIVNPFGGITLSGIIFRGKNSLAILSANASDGGEGKSSGSKILHLGDHFYTSDGSGTEIRISTIKKDSVTLQVINPPDSLPPEMRAATLVLPSLIGWRGKNAGTGTSTAETNPMASSEPESGNSGPKVPKEIQDLLGGQAVDKINSGFGGTGQSSPQTPSKSGGSQ